MKKMILATLAILLTQAAFAGPAVTEGPAIRMPTATSIAEFVNEKLPVSCERINESQVNYVGPRAQNNMGGFIYSVSTVCNGRKVDLRVDTSAGLAPTPERLTHVR
ncbi:MAG TPA: hypothetical protein VN132_06585 [Bdellovibrio sp.]|nr:hypothetical protein [Bdellovibrio sp.]